MTPTDQQLRDAAHRSYGTSCSQLHCKARGHSRTVYLPLDLQPKRDDGGTWLIVHIFVPDEDIR